MQALPAAEGLEGAGPYFASDSRPVILYDGVCGMCNSAVNLALDWDREAAFRFAALQSAAGRALLRRAGRAPDDVSSIVLVEPGGAYIKSEAVRRIAARLNLPLALLAGLAQLVPLGVKDAAYDVVADNRYSVFGLRDECRLGDARYEEGRFLSDP